MLPLILFARFIEVGIQKFTGDIHNSLDSSADWRPIDMDIEHAHEYRNTSHWLVTQPVRTTQFRRRRDNLYQRHQTIGGGNDKAVIDWCGPCRVAEKHQCPCSDAQHWPSKRLPGHHREK